MIMLPLIIFVAYLLLTVHVSSYFNMTQQRVGPMSERNRTTLSSDGVWGTNGENTPKKHLIVNRWLELRENRKLKNRNNALWENQMGG